MIKTILTAAVCLIIFTTSQSQQDTTKEYKVGEVLVKGVLTEEQPVGPYNQPEWTTHRRFPSTRVYLQTKPAM